MVCKMKHSDVGPAANTVATRRTGGPSESTAARYLPRRATDTHGQGKTMMCVV